MQDVYALQDIKAIGVRSKWKPRVVLCAESAINVTGSGTEHVVKFQQGREGAAALISEVICGELFEAGGIPLVPRRFVHVGAKFRHGAPYQITPGVHFGTVFQNNTQCGPPVSMDYVAVPQELVDLWVFDSWVWNKDRDVFGNTLLVASEVAEDKFHIVAVDHSDCFGGADKFSSGNWKSEMMKRGAAESVPFIMQAVAAVGGIAASLRKIEVAKKHILRAIKLVPNNWWREARVNPGDVDEVLNVRASNLEQLINVNAWNTRDIEEATRGGIILNLGGG